MDSVSGLLGGKVAFVSGVILLLAFLFYLLPPLIQLFILFYLLILFLLQDY
jgi:hypothetical protein